MTDPAAPFLVAAVQAAPVFLDREATIEKVSALAGEAGERGAKLAVFPEGFVPAYPLWAWSIPAGDTQGLRALYAELLAQAVAVPGPATDRLCEAARESGVALAVGVNEANVEASGTTLYNTILFIGPDGRLLGKHRKLVPTAGERLVHGQGDGSTLAVHAGKLVAGPAHGEETILYAEVDPRKLSGPRFQLDVAGHYGRPDVFELTVRRAPRPMVRLDDGQARIEPG